MTSNTKGTVCDCIYYRGDNLLEVLRFCKGRASVSGTVVVQGSPICIRTAHGFSYTAQVGTYIVKDGDDIVVYDEATFESKFDLFKGNPTVTN